MKKLLFTIVLIFFTACSYKTTPIIFAFKKDTLSINDQGFLKENSFSKKIEVYNVGQLVFVMKINRDNICINNQCYDKKLFIHNLNSQYPFNLFELIIDKQPLPHLNIKRTKTGFIQQTKNILYIVQKNRILFKDKKKHFLFLIKYHK